MKLIEGRIYYLNTPDPYRPLEEKYIAEVDGHRKSFALEEDALLYIYDSGVRTFKYLTKDALKYMNLNKLPTYEFWHIENRVGYVLNDFQLYIDENNEVKKKRAFVWRFVGFGRSCFADNQEELRRKVNKWIKHYQEDPVNYGYNNYPYYTKCYRNRWEHSNEVRTEEEKEMDFIAIDFETATAKFSSACSLGLVFVKDNQIIDEKYYLIKPPGMFIDHSNTKIHGLTAEILKDAPTFDQVWPEIQHYFHDEHLITAHNAQFDMNVLRNTLSEYNINHPEFNYFCSIPFSTRACRGEGISNSLKIRADYFGIEMGEHHNALSDARTCANLILKCIQVKKRKSVHSYITMHGQGIPVRPFSELNGQDSMIIKGKYKKAKVKISEIAATTTEFDVQHPLFGKTIVFTGELEFTDRKEAMQKAIDLGALVKSGVSSKTDYLIVGKQDISLVGEDGLSGKEEKAYALIEKGHHIQIIIEGKFLEMIRI